MENKEMSSVKASPKVIVHETVFEKAQAVFKTLKDRKASIKFEDLFHDAFSAMDDDYWKQQIDRHTPDEYLLEIAKENPETKKFLIQQARRALEMLNRGEPILKERRKPGPKPRKDEGGST